MVDNKKNWHEKIIRHSSNPSNQINNHQLVYVKCTSNTVIGSPYTRRATLANCLARVWLVQVCDFNTFVLMNIILYKMLHELSLIFYDTGDHIEQIGSPKSCRITCANLPTHTTKVLVHASPCEPVAYKYLPF